MDIDLDAFDILSLDSPPAPSTDPNISDKPKPQSTVTNPFRDLFINDHLAILRSTATSQIKVSAWLHTHRIVNFDDKMKASSPMLYGRDI